MTTALLNDAPAMADGRFYPWLPRNTRRFFSPQAPFTTTPTPFVAPITEQTRMKLKTVANEPDIKLGAYLNDDDDNYKL